MRTLFISFLTFLFANFLSAQNQDKILNFKSEFQELINLTNDKRKTNHFSCTININLNEKKFSVVDENGKKNIIPIKQIIYGNNGKVKSLDLRSKSKVNITKENIILNTNGKRIVKFRIDNYGSIKIRGKLKIKSYSQNFINLSKEKSIRKTNDNYTLIVNYQMNHVTLKKNNELIFYNKIEKVGPTLKGNEAFIKTKGKMDFTINENFVWAMWKQGSEIVGWKLQISN